MGIFSKDEKNGDQKKQEPLSEIDELKKRILETGMPEFVESVALKEIEKLSKTGKSTAEYTIGTNYLTYLTYLPWNKSTDDQLDLEKAESLLNKDHYALAEVKNRILEHLAVRIMKMSRKQSILVVDDEKPARKNLEYVLTKEGYRVVIAASGMEALDALEKDDFDAVITDLKMEKIDGMEVLQHVKKKNPATEVIMVTGYATVPAAVEAMQKGSAFFLSKPLKLEEIRSTVQNALSRKQSRLESKGPVLCFVGPPGTGKTSLGKSISRCLGRKFIRISLAGIKDEAEIRGHRRSYVGALPGRIIQEIRRVEVNNPVIMLDEIDKLGQEFKGDPAAALLELLDPEQNSQFIDHYLDVPFDLSRAMFIATANTTGPIPSALIDRLEILQLSGYTEKEKESIAKNYLIPIEVEENGLSADICQFTPEGIFKIIREYTKEAGLRSLQRQIASICRKSAKEILEKKENKIVVTPEKVEYFLGPPLFHLEAAEGKNRIGVATALALTESGGQIMFVEAAMIKGNSNLILTGSLGNVMKESAQAALSYIRSQTEECGIDESFFDAKDIHVHVPAGAIPKDGPSAGLPIAAALYSLLVKKPCNKEIALSGELTLTGRILPVGGVKEKILAAHRAGVKTIILPLKNEPDVRHIPEELREDLEIKLVDDVMEVFHLIHEGVSI
jgi:ATP-dependent Lon protease